MIATRVAAMSLLVACAALLASAVPAAAASSFPWGDRVAQARRVAAARRGIVGFAVVDEQGRMHAGLHARRGFYSASVVKVVMMTCYLNQPSVRRRALTAADTKLLDPMIRRSADEPANVIYGRYGPGCLVRAARRLGIAGFRTQSVWGRSRVTPIGVARMFRRLPDQLPARHRAYAMWLLAHVTRSQRWGLPPVRPAGWTIRFKGGWAGCPGGGRIVNQGARFERGDRVFTVAVLTNASPSHRYGTESIRRIGHVLLHGYA
jgi:beta-lactamase class A